MNPIYQSTHLNESISIHDIITIHYFEFARDYVFHGERHNFWEFLYVDKGEVEVMADTQGYRIVHGDIVFHKPNEFHSVWANGRIAPNIVVISFECHSNTMSFFENKILKLSTFQRNLLGDIIKEARSAFTTNLAKQYLKLDKSNQAVFASEQLIKIYLEMLLIQLVRDNVLVENKDRLSPVTKERMEEDIVMQITAFLNENLRHNFSFEDICLHFYVGKTYLKTLFKSRTGMGVISYFRRLKIDEAKRLIREGNHNFTEISQFLGYNSIHYFSRVFKNCTHMSPTEYALSIKVKAEL